MEGRDGPGGWGNPFCWKSGKKRGGVVRVLDFLYSIIFSFHDNDVLFTLYSSKFYRNTHPCMIHGDIQSFSAFNFKRNTASHPTHNPYRRQAFPEETQKIRSLQIRSFPYEYSRKTRTYDIKHLIPNTLLQVYV